MISEERRAAILERIAPVPIVRTLGFRIDELDEGFCRATVPLDRNLVGLYGAYHGGLLATAADSIAFLAIVTLTGPDDHLTTSDMNIRFLAACFTDVRVEARVIKIGRSLCPVAVNLFDAGGTHVAAAQVTYFRLAGPQGPKDGDMNMIDGSTSTT